MTAPLQEITTRVLHRARQQGYILPDEVREELTSAGQDETQWKDVLTLARAFLRYDDGRYWYQPALSEVASLRQSQREAVQDAVRSIITHQRTHALERRGEERIEVVQPVILVDEKDQEHHVLSRDLSVTGIRLLGSRRLLGQKFRLRWPQPNSKTSWVFHVQILWTCAVGDDLFENGGSFLSLEI